MITAALAPCVAARLLPALHAPRAQQACTCAQEMRCTTVCVLCGLTKVAALTAGCLATRYTSTAAAEMLGDAFYEATKLICCYFEVSAPWGRYAMLDQDVL